MMMNAPGSDTKASPVNVKTSPGTMGNNNSSSSPEVMEMNVDPLSAGGGAGPDNDGTSSTAQTNSSAHGIKTLRIFSDSHRKKK